MEASDKDILADVSQEHSFITKSGKIVRNLQELHNSISDMAEDEFKHHVNDEKNDFHNWVRDIHGDMKLAIKLTKAKTKHQAARHIRRRIKEHKQDKVKKQDEIFKDVKAIIKTEKKKTVIDKSNEKTEEKESDENTEKEKIVLESKTVKNKAVIDKSNEKTGEKESDENTEKEKIVSKKKVRPATEVKHVFVDGPPLKKHYIAERESKREKNQVVMKENVMQFVTGLLFGVVSLLILKSMI